MTSLNFSVTTPRSFQQPLCKPPNGNDLSSYTIYDYNEQQLNISTKHRQTYGKILIGTTNVQPKIMSLNYAYCKLFNVSNNQHISSTNYLLAVYIYKKLILWSRTAEKPYQCSDCDKRFTPINLQFKGMKYKYDECSELFISEITQTQQLFNSFILSMNYINVIYNKLLMTLVEHGKPLSCTVCDWDWINVYTNQLTQLMELGHGEFKLESVVFTQDVYIIVISSRYLIICKFIHHLNVRY